MPLSPLAGKIAPEEILVNPAELERDFYRKSPDADDPQQLVSFGTSGHRGTPTHCTFNEAHILAISQAIAEYRQKHGIKGPLFIGKDTHAVSGAAQAVAVEVFAANGMDVVIQEHNGFTPTPVISHAILSHNLKGKGATADGIVITPSHNPPEDGGFKYNPPDGGPAGSDVTGEIQNRANQLLKGGNREVRRDAKPVLREMNFAQPYIEDLAQVIDMTAIRSAGISIGVDPLGGASLPYWDTCAERYGLKIDIVNRQVDPRFAFMTVDHDGKIRMDCSSPYAMASLMKLKDKYDVAWANDPDADRHGIVTGSAGLLNPNHYLSVAIHYLLTHRPDWNPGAKVGKTLVSSNMIDKVVEYQKRNLLEVPVGFKWFAPGLYDGTCCFGGEESAGASFLRRNGTVWTTDKDGLILGLLAAEITAVTGKDPGEHYRQLAGDFGEFWYARIDAPATPEQKAAFTRLTPESVAASTLAGDAITGRLTRAPGNKAPIGGLKVTTQNGWFAARPSGTENIYKLYAESSKSQGHLDEIISEAQKVIGQALGG